MCSSLPNRRSAVNGISLDFSAKSACSVTAPPLPSTTNRYPPPSMADRWRPADDIVSAVRDRAPGTDVVITGRGAPQELIDIADTVTEMRLVKHAFEQGIKAKRGIEY